MARSLLVGTLTLATLACVVPARGDWLGAFLHSVGRDTIRRNHWPRPFVYADRQAARAPFAAMVENGWRSQNMIGDHHFTENSGELTDAGRLKVHWILTQAPEQHRTIYVYRAKNAKDTASRVDSVQQYATELLPEGNLPLVVESGVAAVGWPASRVDALGRTFQSSAPAPRIPAGDGGE